MPRKSLERLTFEYLKAASDLEEAMQVIELLPIRANRMLMVEADDRFQHCRDALTRVMKGASITQYIQGIQQVAGNSLSSGQKKDR